ncbi:DUF4136 domain-containing protein [Marinoscillum sp. MHG1-6]|uniref:DUF4136 domain-containing protein n=1 Tax=Marinoscillum sp. MHG1-6 TaxID=2959627 RepID=UPI00215781EE|nr:DUF4136 domain-containing protein [Marinoscillum sp. MHG1-6]
MKTIYRSIVFLSLIMLVACSPGHLVLDATYDFYGNFTAYQTFTFLEDQYATNYEESEIIKRTVYKRLTAIGYKYDPQDPDLYIAYKYFEQPVKMTGFNQSDMGSWIQKSKHTEDKQELLKSGEGSARKFNMPAGSYILSFMDAKQFKVIWQGHFGQHIPWGHPRELEASLMLVMDKYDVTAYN